MMERIGYGAQTGRGGLAIAVAVALAACLGACTRSERPAVHESGALRVAGVATAYFDAARAIPVSVRFTLEIDGSPQQELARADAERLARAVVAECLRAAAQEMQPVRALLAGRSAGEVKSSLARRTLPLVEARLRPVFGAKLVARWVEIDPRLPGVAEAAAYRESCPEKWHPAPPEPPPAPAVPAGLRTGGKRLHVTSHHLENYKTSNLTSVTVDAVAIVSVIDEGVDLTRLQGMVDAKLNNAVTTRIRQSDVADVVYTPDHFEPMRAGVARGLRDWAGLELHDLLIGEIVVQAPYNDIVKAGIERHAAACRTLVRSARAVDEAIAAGRATEAVPFCGAVHADTTTWLSCTHGHAVDDLTPLARLTGLEALELEGLELPDLGPLASLTRLRQLSLRDSKLGALTPLGALTALRTLDLTGAGGVHDLGPLARFKQLTRLGLGKTGATDLTALSGLTSLTHLSLAGVQARDLAPLRGLTALRALDLTGARVTAEGMGSIAALPGLRDLFLTDTDVSLAGIDELAELERLDLSGCNGVRELTPLAGLSELRELGVARTKVADLGPLAGLKALRTLGLSGCQHVRDLSPLTGASALETLDIAGTSVKNLSPLRGSTRLRSISLKETAVTDIGPLRGALELRNVHLPTLPAGPGTVPFCGQRWPAETWLVECADGEMIKDLTPLGRFEHLEVVILRGDLGRADLSPLAGLTKLRVIVMSSAWHVDDLGPLAGLTKLRVLSLGRHSKIDDLAPLAGLTELRELELEVSHGLKDLTPLSGLTRLRTLRLRGAPRGLDLRPLHTLTALRDLDLDGSHPPTEAVEALRAAIGAGLRIR